MALVIGAFLFVLLPQIAVSWIAITVCSRLYKMKGLVWSSIVMAVVWVAVMVYASWPCLALSHLPTSVGDLANAQKACAGGGDFLRFYYAYIIVGLTILGTVIGSVFIGLRMALR